MAKRLNLLIGCCADCPYYHYGTADHYYCDHDLSDGTPIKKPKHLPDWCPLPDDTKRFSGKDDILAKDLSNRTWGVEIDG